MMMRKSKNIQKSFILFFLIFINAPFLALAQNSQDWVVASQAFTYSQNQDSAVTRALSKTFPQKILENILQYSSREILQDELNQRKLYELQTQRTSLFLQLSSEIKKRDALVLSYSEKKVYEKKLKEAEQKISEIKKNIQKNLETQKSVLENNYEKEKKYTDFISQKFEKEESKVIENICIYKNDSSVMFEKKDDDISFEKSIVNEKINALLTGHINVYSKYITVTVELTAYPGEKSIIVVKDYGLIDEIDIIAQNIVFQMNNAITNYLPSTIKFVDFEKDIDIYLDNSLLSKNQTQYIVNAGVHTLEFIKDGYKTTSTSYYFEGNKTYNIKVNLEPLEKKSIKLKIMPPTLDGTFFVNGQEVQKKEDEYSIIVNEKKVLGQFITSDNATSFFYISEKNLQDNGQYDVSFNLGERGANIEKRRKQMYTSYSVLVTSLLPLFYCKGNVSSYVNANALGYITDASDIEKANKWIMASNVASGVSIACGVWFTYELIRYLYEANKVLPPSVK